MHFSLTPRPTLTRWGSTPMIDAVREVTHIGFSFIGAVTPLKVDLTDHLALSEWAGQFGLSAAPDAAAPGDSAAGGASPLAPSDPPAGDGATVCEQGA